MAGRELAEFVEVLARDTRDTTAGFPAGVVPRAIVAGRPRSLGKATRKHAAMAVQVGAEALPAESQATGFHLRTAGVDGYKIPACAIRRVCFDAGIEPDGAVVDIHAAGTKPSGNAPGRKVVVDSVTVRVPREDFASMPVRAVSDRTR
jgi:hypothetical protein